MIRSVALLGLIAALAACNPIDLADQATDRAARAVIVSVVGQELPAPVAEAAATCIIAAASPAELRAVARDFGVAAGSQTVQNVVNLATRPSAISCFASAGVPPLLGAL